ncbi:MAG: hypothetical protein CMO98_05990 [Woeseia sp.]|nr:hypothetical protein [Woeseia sp.]
MLIKFFKVIISNGRLTFLVLVILFSGCSQKFIEPEESSSPARARLLSAQQYINTIAYVFGEDISASIISPLPPLIRTDGLLASGASVAGITSDQVQQLQQVASSVAKKVVDEGHRHFLIPCVPADLSQSDDSCATTFLRKTARLLYRRTIDEDDLESLVTIAAAAANQMGDFYIGLGIALESILISPEVLFIIDSTEPDPDNLGQERLDSYALASRLSFFLWNSPPDDLLLTAAENGDLHTQQGLRNAVNRMLKSSRLETGMRAFFDDMLAFNEFESLAKDPVAYPMVTGATLADAREQTLRTIVDHLLDRDLDYRDLFTTRDTFMSMNLGSVYGVPVVDGWQPYSFPENSPRQGLLTHVSFLAAHSHAVRSSPTLRGRALRELFLCQKVPDAPPNVDFSAIEDAGDVPTARERLMIHSTTPSCAGCHLITDPMGLSLENFDGAGFYREMENGVTLDISGELDGSFYNDLKGLTTAMRNHPKLSYCLVKRLYAYGTGGAVSLRYDRDILAYFEEGFVKQGYKLTSLLSDIALSRAFSKVRTEPFSGSLISVTSDLPVKLETIP